MTEFLFGMQLKKEEATSEVTITWKQSDILGFGEFRSAKYNVFTYETSQGGKVPVYIQDWYDCPDIMVCNDKLQCGMNDGVFFLVYHDRQQKPCQHHFVLNDTQKKLYQENDCLKFMGIRDFTWITGEYLRDL